MRRLLCLTLALSAIAVTAAGCGGSSSTSDPLGNPLSYMPKNSPVVFAISTDLNSDQAKQVGNLLKKVPQGWQLLQSLQQSVTHSSGLNFNSDIKPLLGNDLVVSIPSVQALNQSNSPTIVALKTKDAGKAKTAVARGATKVGSSHGADVYKDNNDGTFSALEDGTLVTADTRAMLDAALARHDGSDHMTKDDFNSSLGDLDKSALVRGVADLQTIIDSSTSAAKAKSVKYVAALRDLGFTVSAKNNSIAVDTEAKTEGLQDSDLPIASGTGSAPVVKRPGELGLGIRDPHQIYNFVIGALQQTSPQSFGQFQAAKQQIGKSAGVDIDKDIVGQLTGNAAVSAATNGSGGFAARAQLKDPAAFSTALGKLAKRLPSLGASGRVSGPKGGFYTLTRSGGSKVVFGVVGKNLVVATDQARATAFAAQSAAPVPDAQGAVALDLDTRALVNQQLKKQGVTPLAQALTGFLGDLTGYLRADSGATRANFTLQLNG
jgi:hypothetical protein